MSVYPSNNLNSPRRQGLYDTHIRLCGVPFLESSNEKNMDNLHADQVSLCFDTDISTSRVILTSLQSFHLTTNLLLSIS